MFVGARSVIDSRPNEEDPSVVSRSVDPEPTGRRPECYIDVLEDAFPRRVDVPRDATVSWRSTRTFGTGTDELRGYRAYGEEPAVTGTRSVEGTPASLRRERAPCRHCGETIETDVPACPHCGNQPLAAVKGGSIVAVFVGTILAVTTSNAALMVWYGPLVGVGLLCGGMAVFWVVTGRYSPTEYDAGGRSPSAESTPIDH